MKTVSTQPSITIADPSPTRKWGISEYPPVDLDTGKPVSPGEYLLTDRTYDNLLVKLVEKKFDGVTPEFREESSVCMHG